jgi:hypothetical protein
LNVLEQQRIKAMSDSDYDLEAIKKLIGWDEREKDPLFPLLSGYGDACATGDKQIIKGFITSNPSILTVPRGGPLINDWAERNDVEMVDFLLSQGACLNPSQGEDGGPLPPLTAAIFGRGVETASFLIERGANPSADRALISAINADEHALEFVKLLVEHGANIHECFDFGGVPVTALSWAMARGKQDIVDYLLSKGATLPPEQPPPPPRDIEDEVIAYFEEHFGPVQPQALIEIVPTGIPIAIHVVPPAAERNHYTLFTTGLAAHPMTVPGDDPSAKDYQFAELYIQLPGDWPIKDSLGDPNYSWPIHWLRRLAKYPHQNNTWLGGPVTVVDNDDPPQPIAPNSKFTSMLLLADRNFTSRGGATIQLYRLSPLYPEERDLERREGLAALMRALDEHEVSFVVNSRRPNAVPPMDQ